MSNRYTEQGEMARQRDQLIRKQVDYRRNKLRKQEGRALDRAVYHTVLAPLNPGASLPRFCPSHLVNNNQDLFASLHQNTCQILLLAEITGLWVDQQNHQIGIRSRL